MSPQKLHPTRLSKGAHRIPKQIGHWSSKSKSPRGESTPDILGTMYIEDNEEGDCAGGADEGDETKEDEDPEAFAPSEYANLNGIQAGLHHRGISAHNVVSGKSGVYSKRNVEKQRSSKFTEAHVKVKADHMTADSEDEDYNAIDFISESDEEEPDIELLEERAIIESEEDNTSDSSTFAALSPIEPFEDWADPELPLTNMSYGDSNWSQEPLANDDSGFLNTFVGHALFPSPLSPHVHFGGDLRRSSSSSDSIISEIDKNLFPDIFMDRLDPKIQGLIENDNEAEAQSPTDSESSEWDLDNIVNTHSGDCIAEGDGTVGNPESLSGYETDEGETTDEEIIPPSTITRPQSLLSLNSSPRPPIVQSVVPTPVRKGVPIPTSRRRGPVMGSWIADPTKPIAVIDSTGKHMVIYPAKRTAKTNKIRANFAASGCSSTDTTPRASVASLSKAIIGSDNDRSDFSSQGVFSPMIGASANLMMTGLFHGGPGSEHVLGGQVVGPPEAFYPWKSFNANGDIENELLFDQDPYNGLDTTNYDEFIEYGSESESNAEATNQDDNVSPTAITFPTVLSTPQASSSAPMSTTQDFLQHFDKGIVSAFRHNQSRHKAMLDRHSPSASNLMYGMKATYATMNAPLSPLRKRKGSFGHDKGGHKRSKSSY